MLTLLKSKNKSSYYPVFFTMLTLSALAAPSYSQDNGNKDWQVHGFVAQGLIDVNGSDFVNESGNLTGQLTEVGLNASYQLSPSIRLTGQAVYLDGGNRYVKGFRIDYALIDWSVFNDSNWLVNLYLGRFKNNHWLYSGTRDVPHTRPSIILPQALYFDGFRDIAMGSDGGALRVNYSAENLGDFDFNLSYGSSNLSEKDVNLLLGDFVQGNAEQKHDAQASVYWQPAFSQWRIGASVLDSSFSYNSAEVDLFVDGDFTFEQIAFSALYEGEFWEFSSEVFQQKFKVDCFYFSDFSQEKTGQGAYVQTRYKLNDKVTLLARAERFYADKNDKDGKALEEMTNGLVPAYFGYQNDITLGASFDVSDALRLQMEYHRVEGTARLTPIVLPNVQVNSSKNWDMWAIQLMYWF